MDDKVLKQVCASMVQQLTQEEKAQVFEVLNHNTWRVVYSLLNVLIEE